MTPTSITPRTRAGSVILSGCMPAMRHTRFRWRFRADMIDERDALTETVPVAPL